MNKQDLAQQVVEYINALRDAEDLYTTDEYDYTDNPAYAEWADNVIVSNQVLEAAGLVWESGYCDYVDLQDVMEALA